LKKVPGPELSSSVNNLTTFCDSCHQTVLFEL
jgi:hypothetical protein